MAELIKKKGTLRLHTEINDIIQRVSLLIKEIPEFHLLKGNHDLCVYVLNLVTNMVKSKTIDVEAITLYKCSPKCLSSTTRKSGSLRNKLLTSRVPVQLNELVI